MRSASTPVHHPTRRPRPLAVHVRLCTVCPHRRPPLQQDLASLSTYKETHQYLLTRLPCDHTTSESKAIMWPATVRQGSLISHLASHGHCRFRWKPWNRLNQEPLRCKKGEDAGRLSLCLIRWILQQVLGIKSSGPPLGSEVTTTDSLDVKIFRSTAFSSTILLVATTIEKHWDLAKEWTETMIQSSHINSNNSRVQTYAPSLCGCLDVGNRPRACSAISLVFVVFR